MIQLAALQEEEKKSAVPQMPEIERFPSLSRMFSTKLLFSHGTRQLERCSIS